MALLLDCDWPGNIRELQNVIERAAILAPRPVVEIGEALLSVGGAQPASRPWPEAGAMTLEEGARRHIPRILDVASGPDGSVIPALTYASRSSGVC